MKKDKIIEKLPYTAPFLFVDKILEINPNEIIGSYHFKKNEFFYEGHFKNKPVTPGVILTECMAQIGLVCLGIFLVQPSTINNSTIALSSSNVDFFLPVFPEEEITVHAKKIYFRFNKLKCKVELYNNENKLACKGELAGIIK